MQAVVERRVASARAASEAAMVDKRAFAKRGDALRS